MIKGIIFDVDGTTLDTLNDLYESFNKTLKEFGMPYQSKEQIRMGVGRGSKVLVEKCTPEGTDEETKKKVESVFGRIYNENYNNTTVPYEGVVELLKTLESKGIRLAINSNKGDSFVKGLVEKNFPDISFTEVMGARDDVARKPDPQGPELIIKEMGIKKEEVMYVGDSDVDIKTAKNTGVTSVGCLWGFRDRETLENAGADIIISAPLELLDHIDQEVSL